MRERVIALGGRHPHAGPRDGGGFQVRAEFLATRASVLIRILLADDQGAHLRSAQVHRSLLEAEDEHRGGRRGRQRTAGGDPCRRAPAGYRPGGHSDAGARRHRGHPADRRGRAAGQCARRHPQQLRAPTSTSSPRCAPGPPGSCSSDTEPGEPSCRVMRRHGRRRRTAVPGRHQPPDSVSSSPGRRTRVAAAGMENLTNRMREVVALVAHGPFQRRDRYCCHGAEPTIAKTHVSRAMINLGAWRPAQLGLRLSDRPGHGAFRQVIGCGFCARKTAQ